jgi:hypothetical protein
VRISAALCAGACLATGSALSQGLPATFDEALGLAQKQDKDPTMRTFERGPFMADFSPRYSPAIAGCLRANPTLERLVFVLVVDAEGRLARVYGKESSAVMRCIEQKLAGATFPRPPSAPFVLELRIDPKPKR